MNDKKIGDVENGEDKEKGEDCRVCLENLDVTPGAKALLVLSFN